MAITTSIVRLRIERIYKLINGVDSIGFNNREMSLCKTSLQRCLISLESVITDVEGDFFLKNEVIHNNLSYNFTDIDIRSRIIELREAIYAQSTDLIEDYKGAHDTTCVSATAFMLPTHLITAIMSLQEAIGWMNLEIGRRKELENEK